MSRAKYSQFLNALNSVFTVTASESAKVDITLKSVNDRALLGADFEGFLLIFEGERSQGLLGPGTWTVTHEHMGVFDMYLEAIRVTDGLCEYQSNCTYNIKQPTGVDILEESES